MRRKMFLALLLLLLLGGGFGIWEFGLPYLQELKSEEPLIKEEPLHITLEPLIVPIIREGAVTGHLILEIQLEVPGLAAEAKLRERLPRLTDAFMTELHSLTSLRYVQDRGRDLPFFKQRLRKVADRILGPGVLGDVLIDGLDDLHGRQKGA